jgi:hypothetical protein
MQERREGLLAFSDVGWLDVDERERALTIQMAYR